MPNRDALPLAGRTPLFPEPPPVEALVEALCARDDILQEALSGIHNPWGAAVAFTEPWRFLELCEAPRTIELVRQMLGPDIILSDSELYCRGTRYGAFARAGGEGRYWPITPCEGAVVLVRFAGAGRQMHCLRLSEIRDAPEARRPGPEPIYVIRYMPATSRFDRAPEHPANRRCMEERVLVNYANRPLWLVSGENRANNDLVSGFAPAVPSWAGRFPAAQEEDSHAVRHR